MTGAEIFEKLMALKARQWYIDDNDEDGVCALLADVGGCLELTNEQIIALGTPERVKEEVHQDDALPVVDPSEYEITDGYIGSFGKAFKTATHETFMRTVEAAAAFNNVMESVVIDDLLNGKPVKWCQSANYAYDHSHGVIRRKAAPKIAKMVRCVCGHSVPSSQVMSTSSGTSCPDCYDRMSL